ncbi:hypothetical protein HPB51_015052 [Rhipicephalus microplus]|uniref:Uncharacterized protein n=1 Tax=Rhipicephalus microplus TaxID=6941 RepID=A0A9J6ETL0_RHIMP|nr:hypothetical protein HPB51_015052 [Rhipicephalus microplus]
MDEDRRPLPPPKSPPWSRRLLGTDRENASRTRRAVTESTSSLSSTRLVLPDGVTGEDCITISPDMVFRRRTLYHDTRPLCDEPRSLSSQSKPFELGLEDQGGCDAAKPRARISASSRKATAVPRLRNPPLGIASDMGDAVCFVALSSPQQRHKATPYPRLKARDDESAGRSTRGGRNSQTRFDDPESEPSVEVSWR